MSAANHVNKNQMRLFFTAGELMDLPTSDSITLSSLNKDQSLAKEKLTEAKTGTVHSTRTVATSSDKSNPPYTFMESIRLHGVQKPVELIHVKGHSTPIITNGNHRIVAANDINPNMYVIPEYRQDDWYQSSDYMRKYGTGYPMSDKAPEDK